MIKLNRGLSVGEETRNIYSQIISFYDWGGINDLRPIIIQTVDKTMRVVRNLELQMEQCFKFKFNSFGFISSHFTIRIDILNIIFYNLY